MSSARKQTIRRIQQTWREHGTELSSVRRHVLDRLDQDIRVDERERVAGSIEALFPHSQQIVTFIRALKDV